MVDNYFGNVVFKNNMSVNTFITIRNKGFYQHISTVHLVELNTLVNICKYGISTRIRK